MISSSVIDSRLFFTCVLLPLETSVIEIASLFKVALESDLCNGLPKLLLFSVLFDAWRGKVAESDFKSFFDSPLRNVDFESVLIKTRWSLLSEVFDSAFESVECVGAVSFVSDFLLGFVSFLICIMKSLFVSKRNHNNFIRFPGTCLII